MNYSPEYRDAILRRMLPPNNESITKIAKEEGLSEQTLRNWRNKARKEGYATPGKEYYQLIVTCEEDVFENDVVTVSTNRALCESLVPPEIYERCSALTDEGKEELKRIPAIIC